MTMQLTRTTTRPLTHESATKALVRALLAHDAKGVNLAIDQAKAVFDHREATGIQLDALYRVKAMNVWDAHELEIWDATLLVIERTYARIVEVQA